MSAERGNLAVAERWLPVVRKWSRSQPSLGRRMVGIALFNLVLSLEATSRFPNRSAKPKC